MSKYANLDDLNALYQEKVGRNIDKGGFDYWNEKLAQGTTTLANIGHELDASKEFKDRADAVSKDPNITEAELDKLDSAFTGTYATRTDQHNAAA